jgi:hypothetical protein
MLLMLRAVPRPRRPRVGRDALVPCTGLVTNSAGSACSEDREVCDGCDLFELQGATSVFALDLLSTLRNKSGPRVTETPGTSTSSGARSIRGLGLRVDCRSHPRYRRSDDLPHRLGRVHRRPRHRPGPLGASGRPAVRYERAYGEVSVLRDPRYDHCRRQDARVPYLQCAVRCGRASASSRSLTGARVGVPSEKGARGARPTHCPIGFTWISSVMVYSGAACRATSSACDLRAGLVTMPLSVNTPECLSCLTTMLLKSFLSSAA